MGGYLRKLSLVIFEGDEDAEEGDMRKAYETYSFYFGKQDKDFCFNRSSKHQGDIPMGEPGNNMPSELTEERIVKSTKRLLRRLIAGTQELDLLPEVAHLTVCLEYYDDITPKDYHPKGYGPSEYTPQLQHDEKCGENQPYFMGMGQIDIMHQKMALRLKSKAGVLSEDDELHPSSLAVEAATHAVNAISLENESGPCQNGEQSGYDEGMEIGTAQLSKEEYRKMKMKSKRKELEDELIQINEMESKNKKYKKWSTYKSHLDFM